MGLLLKHYVLLERGAPQSLDWYCLYTGQSNLTVINPVKVQSISLLLPQNRNLTSMLHISVKKKKKKPKTCFHMYHKGEYQKECRENLLLSISITPPQPHRSGKMQSLNHMHLLWVYSLQIRTSAPSQPVIPNQKILTCYSQTGSQISKLLK